MNPSEWFQSENAPWLMKRLISVVTPTEPMTVLRLHHETGAIRRVPVVALLFYEGVSDLPGGEMRLIIGKAATDWYFLQTVHLSDSIPFRKFTTMSKLPDDGKEFVLGVIPAREDLGQEWRDEAAFRWDLIQKRQGQKEKRREYSRRAAQRRKEKAAAVT